MRKVKNITIDKGFGDLQDVIDIIVEETNKAIPYFKKAALNFKADSLEKSSFLIWNFIKKNIKYFRDQIGIEQIRTPERTLSDKIGDCEDYAIFAAAILDTLGYNPKFHIVAMNKGYQHIYVVVDNIVVDGVMDVFNKHPEGITKYIIVDLLGNRTYKNSFPMKNYLSGMQIQVLAGTSKQLPEQIILADIKPYIAGISNGNVFIDADVIDDVENYIDDFYTIDGLGNPDGLGKIRSKFWDKTKDKFNKVKNNVKSKIETSFDNIKNGVKSGKVTDFVKKTTLAPARAPFLVLLKLNAFHMASKLYIGYLSEQQAKKLGFDLDAWAKIVNVKNDFEKYWKKAGGDINKLKKVVTEGKAKKWIDKKTNVNGIGDPATGTTIAAATTVSSPIWGFLLKLFSKAKGAYDKILNSKAGDLAKKAVDFVKKQTGGNLTQPQQNDNQPPASKGKTNIDNTDDSNNSWIIPVIGVSALAALLFL